MKQMTSIPFSSTIANASGERTSLDEYRGKALLLVNVASRCGFTPQYEQLELLQQKYGERGLQVLGFPCNQFAGQEPGTNEEIAEFCAVNYGVSFPVFGKIRVNGLRAHPIYRALHGVADAAGRAGRVRWNFEKFLIAPDGTAAGRYRSKVRPDSPELVEAIERLLK
jgi:glutathione peroxidase